MLRFFRGRKRGRGPATGAAVGTRGLQRSQVGALQLSSGKASPCQAPTAARLTKLPGSHLSHSALLPPPPAGEGGPRRPWRRASPRALTGGPGFPSTLFLCLATSTGHFITFLPNGRNLHRSRLCPGKLGVGVRGEQPHGLPVSVRKEAPHAATLPYPPVQRRGGGQRP